MIELLYAQETAEAKRGQRRESRGTRDSLRQPAAAGGRTNFANEAVEPGVAGALQKRGGKRPVKLESWRLTDVMNWALPDHV